MGYVSAVYFSNWSVYEPKHFPSQLQAHKLTHVFYAFMRIDPDSGNVSLSDPWADIEMPIDGQYGALGAFRQLKLQNRNLKVMMSIGGWGTAHAFTLVMASETKKAQFVASTVDLVQQYKFDGVDIDWEYPASSLEGTQLVKLLESLKKALLRVHPNLHLTVATLANPEHFNNLHVVEMDRHLTFWNVMCYDFAGAGWSASTGFHSNLFSSNGDNKLNCDAALAAYRSCGVPPHKLVMGMPMYGRSFSQPTTAGVGSQFIKSQSSDTADTVDYRDIHPVKEFYYPEKVAAFTIDEKKNLFITYDSARCAAEKARYVRALGLRGGFWWDSKGDGEPSLVSAFVEVLGQDQLERSDNWV